MTSKRFTCVQYVFGLCANALLLVCQPAYAAGAERFPQFEGTVLPINTPMFAEYHSYDSTETMAMEFEVQLPGESDTEFKMEISTERQVRRSGEILTQRVKMLDFKFPGTRIPRKEKQALSRLTFILTGDVRGKVAKAALAEPEALRALFPDGDVPREGTAEYSELMSEMTSNAESMPTLTAEAITTGTVLASTRLWDQLGEEAVPPELQQLFANEEIQTVVKGWGFYDGRKVLVAQQSFETAARAPGGGGGEEISLSFVMHGYSLFDATSFAPIKSDVLGLLMMESIPEAGRGVIRFRGISDAKVTNRAEEPSAVVAAPSAIPTVTGLSIQSKQEPNGSTKTFVFFDLNWKVSAPAGGGISGKLILLDLNGRERAAMPWPISASNAALGNFAETGVGFELSAFGEAAQWLRLVDVSTLKARFEVSSTP